MSQPIDPQIPRGLILPSSTAMQGNFLASYTPSPHDGKFASDLLLALQNHTPLTFLQKVFVFVVAALPGSMGWKLAVFQFLSTLSLVHILIFLASICLVLALVSLLRKYGRHLITKKQTLVFLELTFPSMTSKTAYATEQLFTLLHTLAGQRKLAHRMLGHKKQYSLEIVASREQGIRYILAVDSADAPIIQKNLLSYLPGLKIKEISDHLPSDLCLKKKDRSRDYKVIELKQASDFVLPLQAHKTLNEHDPIAYLTGNMTKLKPDELIVFQAVVTPLLRSSHRGSLKHLGKIQQRIYLNQTLADKLFADPWQKILLIPWAIFKFLLKSLEFLAKFIVSMVIAIWDTKGENVPFFKQEQKVLISKDETQNPYEQQLQAEVKEKIDQPLFESSLRLLLCSTDPKQSNSRISGFLASFGSLGSAYQSLVLRARSFISLLPSPRLAFATRQVSFAGNPILSASELTDIYHFPYTETTKTEDMVKAKNQPLPAPLSFKQTATKFDNVFATNSYGGSETVIGQTLQERQRHTYILGATGSGKTTLISNMIYQDIINGKGLAVIDPHGQLVEKLLSVIPKERIKDIVWFAPDDDAYPIALNLLELPKSENGQFSASQLQKQKSLVASSLISVMQKFYDAKYFGPRMEYVLRNTILTALETPDPTLQTILDLLTKSRYRNSVVKGLQNKVLKDYWTYEFKKLGSMQENSVISPITNKIGGILSSPINYNILTQTKSKLDFDNVINNKKILLCDLSKGKIGEDESSFFGSLVIAKIQLAALKRAQMSEEQRKDFFLYVDEFQNFATQSFSELVSEARKYHLATILAHQSISQIENRDIIKIILANVGTVICFKTANPEDEQFILPIFSPEVLKHEIGNLPLYNFYMKVSVGQAEDTFLAEADNFTIAGNKKTTKAVIEQSRKNYANSIKAPVLDLRQSPEKVSHSDKTPETQNDQIQDQKSDNLVTYPIQRRSKDGIGNKENIKQNIQNNSTTKTKLQTIPTTPQQQQILSLIYRFRFLDRTQIQQLMNHKNHKRILIWLNDLNEKKLIKTVETKSVIHNAKTKIYYLTKNAIPILASQDIIDKSLLQKLYREDDRSANFVNQCQLVAKIYLDLQNLTTKNYRYLVYVKNDYSNHEFATLLSELSPHAYIEQTKAGKTKCCFLEILPDIPLERLRLRIKKYLSFYQNSEWEVETNQPFPNVLVVCSNQNLSLTLATYVKRKMYQMDEPDLKINFTTAEKVKEFGITDDLWKR